MDANVTAPQSEPDQDNSSLQNPSTNPAEAGTTDETRDDDHETSSIEALNWSEVEEEELAAAQLAAVEAAASITRGKLPPETTDSKLNDKDDDTVTNNGSSTNEEGSVLSTSLLQSINSTVSDEDPQARKLSVIENWASEVTNAVERGEIEMSEDFPEENEVPGDDENEETTDSAGVRKRKGNKLSPEMVSSLLSSVSNGESITDPLSNAPVLDDGPIWNKGPRSYTFQENRGINQKLTFCLLIAVVLAIGLGLGNLVAHQECEAEYKASQQQSQMQHADKISVHTVPTTTTPAPIIPDRSTDSSMMGSQLPKKQPISYVDSVASDEDLTKDSSASSHINIPEKRHENIDVQRRRKRDEPVIDPKYKIHAETVSNVVHTLDRLSRKIDQNENTTRKLQGVLMIPEEEEEEKSTETSTESSLLYDEEVHTDNEEGIIAVDSDDETDPTEEENEEFILEELIEAIEQTPDYLEMKREEKRWEKYDEEKLSRPTIFDRNLETDPIHPDEQKDIDILVKTVHQFKDFQRRFVKSERKRLKEEGKYDRFSWRLPEEYTTEEKNALRVRYRSNWQEFLKLIKNKVPDPIEALFGAEEEDEERPFRDIFHFDFPDPLEDNLASEEYDNPQYRKNLVDLKTDQTSKLEADSGADKEIASDTNLPLGTSDTTPSEEIDDLIITEIRREYHSTTGEPAATQDVKSEPGLTEKVQSDNDIGKSTINADQSTTVEKLPATMKVENVESKFHTGENIEDGTTPQTKGKDGDNFPSSGKEENVNLHDSPLPIPASKKSANEATHSADNFTNSRGQSVKGNVKIKKVELSQKQKDQKNKQGKQKVKNENMRGYDQNAGNVASGGKVKMSSKGKKLKNMESNKVFENIKGKNFDKRRGVSPEHSGNTVGETQYADIKYGKNAKSHDPAPKKYSQGGGKEAKKGRGDTSSDKKETQKMKTSENPKKQQTHNVKDEPSKDRRGTKDQKRQEYQRKSKADSRSLPKSNPENKETQFRQQKVESRNNYKNSESHQNGKKSKSWPSKEKVERARERDSSWGN